MLLGARVRLCDYARFCGFAEREESQGTSGRRSPAKCKDGKMFKQFKYICTNVLLPISQTDTKLGEIGPNCTNIHQI